MAQIILTAIGNDRPGLVGELTGALHGMGANILETRMVNLRGRFAVMVLFEGREVKPAELEKAGQAMGLAVTLTGHAAAEATPRAAHAGGLPFKLKTYSLDQPGLVHAVSEVLRRHGVNIEDLAARQESAAFSGDLLFTMEMRLTVPAGVSVKKLRGDLEGVCEKLNADLDLEAG